MPLVYAFDHKHRRAPMEMKDLLGGKGANLAEMTSVLAPAGAAGLHHHHRRLPRLHGRRLADGLDEEVAKQVTKLEKDMGRTLGDPGDPLLVSVRSGAKFSMPGMMDTVLNLGPERRVGARAGPVDRRRALRLRLLPPVHPMYGRIVLDIEGEAFDEPLEPPRRRSGPRPTPTSRRGTCASCAPGTRRSSRSTPASPSRRSRWPSSRARSRPCSHRGTAPGRSPTAPGSASPTTSAPP